MAPAKRPSGSSAGGRPSKSTRYGDSFLGQSSSQNPNAVTPYGSPPSHAYPSAPPSSLGQNNQHPPRSTWVEEDDEDSIDLTQEDNSSPIEFYGTMDNKIVGVRYYNGVVTPGEMVLIRREPGNPYDSNAIRVDNAMGIQVGHLPRNVAMKLAPYIDRDVVVLEGLLSGHKGAFDCPVRLYVYGTSDPSARLSLEERLKNDKLLKATQLKATRKEAEAQRAVAAKLKNDDPAVGLGSSQSLSQRSEQAESLQGLLDASVQTDFRADLDSIDSFAMEEAALVKLPKAQQPESIGLHLLPYQLQVKSRGSLGKLLILMALKGLAWMTAKEKPQVPAPGSKDVVQLWQRNKRDQFQNLISGHVTTTRPTLLSGGVLCDDMGLGKTVQIISLIMTSGFSDGPTLIIAPTGVMSNWEQQIRKHVKKDRMPRIMRYHRILKDGALSAADFLKYDIVITSYGKVGTEFSGTSKGKPLYSVDWRRIVLDEGHIIRNPDTRNAKAACGLQAKSRWVLTGTPIINNVFDFLSTLQFLRITGGAENKGMFSTKIGRPLSSKLKTNRTTDEHKEANVLLTTLTHDLCLRRRKDMEFIDLKLPEKFEYLTRVVFREEELTKYNAMMSQAQGILHEYQRKAGSKRKSKSQEITFANVLERLLRLRQMCCHWTLCGERVTNILRVFDDQKVVKFTPENLKILQEALRQANSDAEDCPICYENIKFHVPVITACKHRFGKDCISKAIESDERCPMCRQPLTLESLVDLQPVDEVEEFNGNTQSSKTEMIEGLVRARLQEDSKSKIVIFSQWTSFLNIIEKALEDAGFTCCRLEGSMSPAKRDDAIKALETDPKTQILLASLGASSVGLNLVAANTVMLADCWWAPAIEDQAIDRVHRLGQKRPVKVYKLVVDGSVEERVVGIQVEKRKLVALAFEGEGEDRKMKELHKADVQKLLA